MRTRNCSPRDRYQCTRALRRLLCEWLNADCTSSRPFGVSGTAYMKALCGNAGSAGEAGAPAEPEGPEAAKLDIRVGRIVQIETHPDADRCPGCLLLTELFLGSVHCIGHCKYPVLRS